MNSPGQRDPASYSAQELADPRVDPTTLRQIAAVRPDLWRLVHDHPNCDRELAGYIRQNSQPLAPPPPSPPGPQPQAGMPPQGPRPQTGAQPAGPWPPAGPQPPNGLPPQTGPQRPGPPPPGWQQPPPGAHPQAGGQQMASGAKHLADGAKSYFTNTVAPAATSAAQTVSQRSGQAPGAVHWTIWFRFAVPALALLGIISLFMPLASVSYMGRSMSINYFSEEAPSGEGVLMLIAFLLVIGFAVVSLLTGKKWALITAGVLAIVVGLIGMLNGFGTAAAVSGELYGSAGIGSIFLGIAGMGLIASGIITLLPQNRPAVPQF